MIDPASALLGFGALLLGVLLLAWPAHGLAARTRRLRRRRERVRVEDALKHIYHCEYAGGECSLETLAGALEVPQSEAARLVARMEARGLVRSTHEGAALTEQGREYALHVVRSHRLWEQYLAQRTGVAAREWHDQAEQREHSLTVAEAAALSAQLGHPRFDPHGDPIPTADGAVPPSSGLSLTALAAGDVAVITHLEDEPRAVYEQLVAAGLSPHARLEVLASERWVVRFRVEGREHALEPVAAASVTVQRLEREQHAREPAELLSDLRTGESARVVRIAAACQGQQRRRLLDLGVVADTPIKAVLASTSGDPVAYEIRGALIALRSEQAQMIQVQREPAGTVAE